MRIVMSSIYDNNSPLNRFTTCCWWAKELPADGYVEVVYWDGSTETMYGSDGVDEPTLLATFYEDEQGYIDQRSVKAGVEVLYEVERGNLRGRMTTGLANYGTLAQREARSKRGKDEVVGSVR